MQSSLIHATGTDTLSVAHDVQSKDETSVETQELGDVVSGHSDASKKQHREKMLMPWVTEGLTEFVSDGNEIHAFQCVRDTLSAIIEIVQTTNFDKNAHEDGVFNLDCYSTSSHRNEIAQLPNIETGFDTGTGNASNYSHGIRNGDRGEADKREDGEVNKNEIQTN